MKRNKLNIFAVLFLVVSVAVSLGTDTVFAYDDFGRMVHHIESTYHVHRSNRFVLGCAGLVVRFWHVGGVKNLKIANFEDQHFDLREGDGKLDEIASHAIENGWQPMVRSFSRRSGEHNYVLVRQEGKDLKMLILNLEPHEANVVQVKVDPEKLEKFMDENVGNYRGHHGHATHGDAASDVQNMVMSFR